MRGRAFLAVAQDTVSVRTEAHSRATVIHAYYALFLECRDSLAGWGITILPRQNVHSAVRLRFLYSTETDLQSIGDRLDRWCQRRNRASYNLMPLADFASDAFAQLAIVEVADALALLDAIEADPVRRATAIASFPP